MGKEVLWRQKEQFSDGVGYSWIDGVKEYANSMISDEQLANAHHRFPKKTPRLKRLTSIVTFSRSTSEPDPQSTRSPGRTASPVAAKSRYGGTLPSKAVTTLPVEL